jgi:hypothetical protein
MYQTEWSPISIVSNSIVEGQEIVFIPVVIQQMYHEEFDKEEHILYRSSEVLYNVSIQGGGSFPITLLVQPELFLVYLGETL